VIQPWKVTRSEPVADCRVFRVRKDTSISPKTGKSHEMFVIESDDFVNIVPLTAQNEVILVEQFRHGSKEISLETPGGLIDKAGESPIECARRELLEETGYEAESCEIIGEIRPNAAIMNNKMFYVLAKNCRKVSEPRFDFAEDIEVKLVPLAEIPELIRQKRITHSLVVAAFYFLNDSLARAGQR
jgi:ADP-ribose pyrophosphatase